MSKIYEALLRAELERTVTKGERVPEDAAALAVQTLLTPGLPEHSEFEANDPLGPMYVEGSASVEPEIAPLPPAMEFETARHLPWAPLPGILPSLEERGPHVEQFRSLRSHLMEFRDTAPLKSVVISSGLPAEGKSYVALNVALAFARHKSNRVLLIDGDMRRSSLHRLLGTTKEPGLTDFLAGEVPLSSVLQQAEQSDRSAPMPAGLSTLTFIPGGRNAENAGDLASGPKFAELIAAATAHFDWVFVDSPPANLVADAVSLARACNGVLLVVREGVTKFKTAQEAQHQFKSANVLGVVLNAVHKLPIKSDYYGSYDTYKTEG